MGFPSLVGLRLDHKEFLFLGMGFDIYSGGGGRRSVVVS